MKRPIFFVLILSFACQSTLEEDKDLVKNLMERDDENFRHILNSEYRSEVIYTRIERDSLNKPSFDSYSFSNTDPSNYFYPASTVKLPATILALEKINNLDIVGLDSQTAMLTDSLNSSQSSAHSDSTSQNLKPSIDHYIKKILMVSDNDAHNRLYEFLGQRYFNERMWELGFKNTRMTHRLSIFLDQEENANTNPIRFVKGDSIVYQQLGAKNQEYIQAENPILLGEAHYADGELLNEPMNFQFKNHFPLNEQTLLMRKLFFPEVFDKTEQFNLRPSDYQFLWKYMSQWPSESTFPNYTDHKDNYVKFIMFGDGDTDISKDIRVFNKVGQAYGFLIENAYVVDFKNQIEFLVSAYIYVNDNKTLNDGEYEYDRIGFPFFSDLGNMFYQYELDHPHKIKPNLDHLIIRYDNSKNLY